MPVLITAAWVYKAGFDREIEAVEEKHLLLAQNLSTVFQRYGSNVESVFHAVANSLQHGQSIRQMPMLLQTVSFDHVCNADADGNILGVSTVHPELETVNAVFRWFDDVTCGRPGTCTQCCW